MNRFFVETRSELSGNTLRGHAAVFDTVARMGRSYERIAPGAFARVLEGSDVRALINHDPSLVIGRQSAGTLRLQEDATGLAFEVDLPDTQAARDLRELVSRGDISGASFGFIRGDVTQSRSADGTPVTTHTAFRKLLDVSPVTFPAYDSADVQLRAIELTPGSPREQRIRLRANSLRGTQ